MAKKNKNSCIVVLLKMTILIIILCAAIAGGIIFAYNKLNEFFNRGGTVIVPDFRGMHIREVIENKPKNIEIVKSDEKYDDRCLKDHVIAQFPEPGTPVKPGRKVLLSISLGLQKVNVPDLVGADQRQVDLALMNAQLSVGDKAYVFSDTIMPDRVVGQSPLPAEEYGINKKVDLLISLGKKIESYYLPNLVGSTLDEAKTKVTSWGFNFGRIFSKTDPSRPRFQVISTWPSPYSKVKKGDVISVLISAGADKGTATLADLRKFEVTFSSLDAEKPLITRPIEEIRATSGENVTFTTPKVFPPTVSGSDEENSVSSTLLNHEEKEITFVMPDGFMPKEVKFIHVTPQGRQQIYAGTHKPLEVIKVKVPFVPNTIVKIYLNDIPIEDRKIE